MGERDPNDTREEASAPEPHQSLRVSAADTRSLHARGVRAATDQLAAILPKRFRPKRTLGKGGMGVVIAARDTVLRRDVAIKLLHHDLAREREHELLEEARAAAELRHEAIVTIFDVDPDGRYIVMELVDGETLEHRLAERGRLAPAEVYRLGRALLGGLVVAHAAGIIHRDVKPGNVLLGKDGGIKLNDFGVARRVATDRSPGGAGTIAYMAPEVWNGAIENARTDIFSLGVVLYEAATGRAFRGGDGEDHEARAVLAETRDPELAKIVARAIAVDPAARFASAAEFGDALAAADPARAPTRAPAIALGAGAIVIVGAIVGFLVFGGGKKHDDAAAPAVVVATLPFVDRTGQARLDFAQSGLPHLLASELRRQPGITVVGYYQLLERAPHPPAAADVAGWRERAQQLGASIVVSGTLAGGGDDVTVTLAIARVDGTALATLPAHATTSGVPAAVRARAGDVAAIVTGRRATKPGAPSPGFDVERDLALGIDALQQLKLDAAERLLGGVLERAPTQPDAAYYYALTVDWHARPEPQVEAAYARALATDLAPEQRGVLTAFEMLYHRHELDAAIAYARALAEEFPSSPDVQYALSEALFHGGYPAEGMAVFRQMSDAAPTWRLAIIHPLTYYLLHGDDDGARWAVGKAQAFDDNWATAWAIRLRFMHGDLDGAYTASLAEATALEHRGETSWWGGDLTTYAMIAEDIAAIDRVAGAGGLTYQISTWRGDAPTARRLIDDALAAHVKVGRVGAFSIASIGRYAVMSDDDAFVARVLAALDQVLAGDRLSVNEQLGRAFLLARLHRGDELAALAKSTVPEVAAVASALIANAGGDPARARWDRAFELSADGNFALLGQAHLARALLAAGDRAGVIDACARVLRPRFIDPSYAAVAPSCLVWSGEAAEQLGDRDKARQFYTRALAIRIHPDDPLHETARAGLGRVSR